MRVGQCHAAVAHGREDRRGRALGDEQLGGDERARRWVELHQRGLEVGQRALGPDQRQRADPVHDAHRDLLTVQRDTRDGRPRVGQRDVRAGLVGRLGAGAGRDQRGHRVRRRHRRDPGEAADLRVLRALFLRQRAEVEGELETALRAGADHHRRVHQRDGERPGGPPRARVQVPVGEPVVDLDRQDRQLALDVADRDVAARDVELLEHARPVAALERDLEHLTRAVVQLADRQVLLLATPVDVLDPQAGPHVRAGVQRHVAEVDQQLSAGERDALAVVERELPLEGGERPVGPGGVPREHPLHPAGVDEDAAAHVVADRVGGGRREVLPVGVDLAGHLEQAAGRRVGEVGAGRADLGLGAGDPPGVGRRRRGRGERQHCGRQQQRDHQVRHVLAAAQPPGGEVGRGASRGRCTARPGPADPAQQQGYRRLRRPAPRTWGSAGRAAGSRSHRR